jgi:hypothetical protein
MILEDLHFALYSDLQVSGLGLDRRVEFGGSLGHGVVGAPFVGSLWAPLM